MTEQPRKAVLYAVLGLTCLYHLGIGVVSCLSPETTAQVGAYFYGVHADALSPQFVYMLKALGMYALFTGALLLLALRDPQRYRAVVIACAALLGMRALSRLVFFDALHDAFEVPWTRNLFNIGILTTQACLLLWGLGPAGAPAPEPARAPTARPLSFPDVIASASARIGFNASASGVR